MYQLNKRNLDIIIGEINTIREKMICSGLLNGLTNETTLKYSQELDGLIYEYQQNNSPFRAYQKDKDFPFRQMTICSEVVC